jgi:hypothetical protein
MAKSFSVNTELHFRQFIEVTCSTLQGQNYPPFSGSLMGGFYFNKFFGHFCQSEQKAKGLRPVSEKAIFRIEHTFTTKHFEVGNLLNTRVLQLAYE